jgi:hypothetical protein
MLPEDAGQGAHLPSMLLKLRQFVEILEPVVDKIAIAVKPTHHFRPGGGIARQHCIPRR